MDLLRIINMEKGKVIIDFLQIRNSIKQFVGFFMHQLSEGVHDP